MAPFSGFTAKAQYNRGCDMVSRLNMPQEKIDAEMPTSRIAVEEKLRGARAGTWSGQPCDRRVSRPQRGTFGMTGDARPAYARSTKPVPLEAGADFSDLKEPSQGALGALDHAAVRVCVKAIGGRAGGQPTIGDIVSMDPREMTAAAERMAATGVDYTRSASSRTRGFRLRQGLDGSGAPKRDSSPLCLADGAYDWPRRCPRRCGFTGAMLDTRAQDRQAAARLAHGWRVTGVRESCQGPRFLAALRLSAQGGRFRRSLRSEPDYLGSAAALCSGSTGPESRCSSIRQIRNAIPALEKIGLTI